jgi:hypothetical protein
MLQVVWGCKLRLRPIVTKLLFYKIRFFLERFHSMARYKEHISRWSLPVLLLFVEPYNKEWCIVQGSHACNHDFFDFSTRDVSSFLEGFVRIFLMILQPVSSWMYLLPQRHYRYFSTHTTLWHILCCTTRYILLHLSKSYKTK